MAQVATPPSFLPTSPSSGVNPKTKVTQKWNTTGSDTILRAPQICLNSCLLRGQFQGNPVSLTWSKQLQLPLYKSRHAIGTLVECTSQNRERVGRVGTQTSVGNVSLASFGIRPKLGLHGEKMDLTKSLSGMLPYVVLATAFAALVQPATFAWVSKEYYAPALGGIMLSIGVQLSVKDFELALSRPLPVMLGYACQYILKPIVGMLVARLFSIPSIFAAGFILTACVAGAQLSSYASYLSDGDVALSIVLTSLTTISSVIVTPILTGLLIGRAVPVDGLAMAKSIMQVVLCPVVVGLALNTYAKPAVDIIRPFMPLMAMVCTSLCIGSPLALNRASIASIQGLNVFLPVVMFHVAAFIIGYWVSRLPVLRQEERVSRTLSLCTGMQSSTLAGLLATQFFEGTHAVPPACSVVVMAVMGLGLASFWGKGSRIRTVLKNHSRFLHPSESNLGEISPPFRAIRKIT